MLLPVQYPDAQLVVVGYLRPLVAPVAVGVRIPDQRPDTFVTVRRIGGTATALVDTARMDIYTWALTDIAAYDLANTIRLLMAGIPNQPGVIAIDEFAGPVVSPDPSNQPRWLTAFEISLRGSPSA